MSELAGEIIMNVNIYAKEKCRIKSEGTCKMDRYLNASYQNVHVAHGSRGFCGNDDGGLGPFGFTDLRINYGPR